MTDLETLRAELEATRLEMKRAEPIKIDWSAIYSVKWEPRVIDTEISQPAAEAEITADPSVD